MRSESVFHPSAWRIFAGSNKLRFALMLVVCSLFRVASVLRLLRFAEVHVSIPFFNSFFQRVSAKIYHFGN